ncbi:hypothetical protein SAVIM338S_00006 [Streptomyces avidinii]
MGQEISPSQRAQNLLRSIFEAADEGFYVITASSGGCAAVIEFYNASDRTHLPSGVSLAELVSNMQAATAGEVSGVVLRRTEDSGATRAWGWRVRGLTAIPLTADELRRAYCYDAQTGQAHAPDPGLYYSDAPHISLR